MAECLPRPAPSAELQASGEPRYRAGAEPGQVVPLPTPARQRDGKTPPSGTPVHADDPQIIARCLEGDEDAWNLLVDRYENLVYSQALEVGLSREDAGDVFQQVWLELHRSLSRLRNPNGLPRWLMTATRRLSFKVASRRRRLMSGIDASWADPAAGIDEDMEALEARGRVEWALDKLGGSGAQLLRLMFLHPKKLSYEDIAERTGLAVGSLGPLRARALSRLRTILEEES